MGCNCTANLRADIIKRFFANQFNGKEFALELIRIVECQQDTMSRELEDWFEKWFRFPQDMLEEFLACVMKRQATMSDRLQKVIRARFFPTDQKMADDFIRVVLCGCCPTLCGTGFHILEISDNYTVDGYYLQVDASNIVYMESGIITETIPCESGFADFHQSSGNTVTAGAVWHNNTWDVLITVTLVSQVLGVEFQLETVIGDWFTNPVTGVCQISEDGGVTWTQVGTMSNEDLVDGLILTFPTAAESYIYRVIVTDTVTGCQFYNPAPDTGSPGYRIYYATIDMNSDPLFTLFGSINAVGLSGNTAQVWVDILLTMVAPYQTVAGAVGGIGISFSQDEAAGVFEVPFYLQIITPSATPPVELAVILDSVGTPVDTSPQGTTNVIKNYVATYEFNVLNLTLIQGFKIFGANVRFDETFVTNPATQQFVVHAMEDYQIADSAFTFQVVVNPTNVQFFLTTAVPITDVLVQDDAIEYVVPLIEI